MIFIKSLPLLEKAQDGLDSYQGEVNKAGNYEAQVEEAKRLFGLRNKPSNPVFKEVRTTLAKMCSGQVRCGYCEDSAGDEVEHIYPKDLYPEKAFVWENYLYACGPCNGPKSNKFAVFAKKTGKFTNVQRKKGDQVKPPIKGETVLIDPRHEDPLKYMILDLLGTFLFVPIDPENSNPHKRAEYTIDILGLNKRSFLAEARKSAFGSYVARLVEYRAEKQAGAKKAHLDELIKGIQTMDHPTVWQEMKRQKGHHPKLKALFDDLPEALTW